MTTFEPEGSGKVPGVVVIQEYWGVNDHIKSIAKRWAKEGFLAVAPDLYHGKIAKNAGEATEMMKALDFPKAVQEIGAAIEALRAHPRCNGKVAVTGFCLGGALTLATAANVKHIACAVPFYGIPGQLDASKIGCAVQMHVAEHDDWVKVPDAKKLQEKLGGKMELFTYDAHHAFFNDTRPEVYNAAEAMAAWQQTIGFLLTSLG